ncbi:MAG: hypothetical protein GY836_09105, partial [Herbaspirillum sp.]|uniref:CARDB domain-containing protein n=1 Tax=Herbaspirillum sp. TaxID=1890675 RepID=UPI00258925CF
RLYLGNPGTAAAEVEVPPVAPDEVVEVELLWDTRDLASGSYTLEARADADGTVDESDETNNGGLVTLELVVPTLPDLSAEGLRADSAAVVEGRQVVLTATVVNRGAVLTGGFETAFLVNNAEVGRVTSADDLVSGDLREVSFSLDTLGRPGVLGLEARADPGAGIAESDETNNAAVAELMVEPVSLRAAVATDRIGYGANEPVAVEVTAHNAAEAMVRDLTVRIVDPSGTA